MNAEDIITLTVILLSTDLPLAQLQTRTLAHAHYHCNQHINASRLASHLSLSDARQSSSDPRSHLVQA